MLIYFLFLDMSKSFQPFFTNSALCDVIAGSEDTCRHVNSEIWRGELNFIQAVELFSDEKLTFLMCLVRFGAELGPTWHPF